MSDSNETYVAERENRFKSEAELKNKLALFGDRISDYPSTNYRPLRGLEAVYRYIIDTYKWLPHQVRALSVEDLHLLVCTHIEYQKD